MQDNSNTNAFDDVRAAGPRELRRDALGILATSAMTAAYMGPALSIYALFGPMTEKVGMGVGFVLLIAMVVTLFSAVSFGMLAKEMPSAGGLYDWSCKALGNSLGMFIGLNTIMYYLICLIFAPIIFGQFFNEVLEQVGVVIEPDSAVLVLELVIWGNGYARYRGIRHLSRNHRIRPSRIYPVDDRVRGCHRVDCDINSAFDLSGNVHAGPCHVQWMSGWVERDFSRVAHGFDVHGLRRGGSCWRGNAKRATNDSHRDCLDVFHCWAVVRHRIFRICDGTDVGRHSGLRDSKRHRPDGRTCLGLRKNSRFTHGDVGGVRFLYSNHYGIVAYDVCFAREGKLPATFAKLHPKFLAPWNAIHLSFGFAFVCVMPAVFLCGPNTTIDWWSFTAAWFIGIVYVAANLVNIVYYWRFARSQFNPMLNFVIPSIALMVQVWVVFRSAIVELWDMGAIGRSSQLFMFISAAATIAYSLFMRNRSYTQP